MISNCKKEMLGSYTPMSTQVNFCPSQSLLRMISDPIKFMFNYSSMLFILYKRSLAISPHVFN
jgi:hypothetical protein